MATHMYIQVDHVYNAYWGGGGVLWELFQQGKTYICTLMHVHHGKGSSHMQVSMLEEVIMYTNNPAGR